MTDIEINGRKIGENHPTYFIADIGANHDGDIVRAKHLIELAKISGADAVKFQHFRAKHIVSDVGFKDLVKPEVIEMTKEEWLKKLNLYAKEIGIEILDDGIEAEEDLNEK